MKTLLCFFLMICVPKISESPSHYYRLNSAGDRFILIDVASAPNVSERGLTYLDINDGSLTQIYCEVESARLSNQGLEFAKKLLVENDQRAQGMTLSKLVDWNSGFELHLKVRCTKSENGTIEIKVAPTYTKANIRCSATSPEIWHSDGKTLKKIRACDGWQLLII